MRENVCSAIVEWDVHQGSVRTIFYMQLLFKSSILSLIFLVGPSIIESVVFRSPIIIVQLYISPFN